MTKNRERLLAGDVAHTHEESDMSETDIEYRGHFINVQAVESDDNQWRPEAVVSIYRGGALQKTIVSAPIGVVYDSEEAADTCALAMAQNWIDDNAPR